MKKSFKVIFIACTIDSTFSAYTFSALTFFMARQMQENFRVKGKKLYFGFVDLEKAFDRVPREVISWAMRKLGVEAWLVHQYSEIRDLTSCLLPCRNPACSSAISISVFTRSLSSIQPHLN